MTQLPLQAYLADRVRAWVSTHPRTTFATLCDAFPGENATDLDRVATDTDVLHWDSAGFYVAGEVTP
jgi:hypothetical protein